jgi:hypothetical protein
MIKQRSISGEGIQDSEGSAEFLDALRTNAMDDLHAAAIEYGIVLKDLAVIDRQFKGQSCLIFCEKTCADSITITQARSRPQWTS